MRQPLKPFSVETRQNGRRKLRAPANAPRDIFSGMDPDGSRTQSYDAALRAADMLFGASASQPAPAPQQPAGDMTVVEHTFAAPPPRPQGRVLQAIDEPVMDWAVPVARPAVRRGRPPGSKNKVARVPAAARPVDKHEPTARTDRTADELVASLFGTAELVEPVVLKRPMSMPMPIAMSPGSGERLRFSWISKALGPGERWKRRLPRVCW